MGERMKKKIENVEPEALGFRNCATLAYRSQPLRGGGGGGGAEGGEGEAVRGPFTVLQCNIQRARYIPVV